MFHLPLTFNLLLSLKRIIYVKLICLICLKYESFFPHGNSLNSGILNLVNRLSFSEWGLWTHEKNTLSFSQLIGCGTPSKWEIKLFIYNIKFYIYFATGQRPWLHYIVKMLLNKKVIVSLNLLKSYCISSFLFLSLDIMQSFMNNVYFDLHTLRYICFFILRKQEYIILCQMG